MNRESFERVSELFRESIKLDANARRDLLDAMAKQQPDVVREVSRLLDAEENIPAYLKDDEIGPSARRRAAGALLVPREQPESIGSYTVEKLLGVGGMGIVYLARDQQDEAVAIKVIRAGVVSEQTIRRFQHEARVLGTLDHDGIARVQTIGTTTSIEGEQPYFVMEYVDGLPLLEFAEAHQLDLRQRIQLVAQVCDAVQHAHLRGVIHRDLKPANILVMNTNDESGVSAQPKILDFGVARATDLERTSTTMHTATGQLIGTLQYMSPEQIDADPHDIDVRSDVYALGLLAYELFTGRLPYECSGKPMYEAARLIKEYEPARPSTWNPGCRGDLDTIILKALQKERPRRYQSAAALADDLRHHLAGEPVEARRGSAWYMARTWARRHRLMVSAAAVLVLLTSLSIGGWMYLREQEFQQAKLYLELLGLDTDDALGDPLKLAESTPPDRLHDYVRLADSLWIDEPEIDARARLTIGLRFHAQGLYADAEQQLQLARDRWPSGGDALEYADVHEQLARAQYHNHHYDASIRSYEESMRIRREVLGEHETIALCLDGIGACLKTQGRFDAAEPYYRDALAIRRERLGDEHIMVAVSQNNVGTLLMARGQYSDAEPLVRLAFQRAERDGVNPLYMARGLRNLGRCLLAQGRVDQARTVVEQSLEHLRADGLNDHPDAGRSLLLLARCAAMHGDRKTALELAERARSLAPDATAEAGLFLVDLHLEAGDIQNAELELQAVLECRTALYPPGHPHVLAALLRLAEIRVDTGDVQESQKIIERIAPQLRDTLAPIHEDIVRANWLEGRVLMHSGQFDEASGRFDAALRSVCRRMPEERWEAGRVRISQAACMAGMHRYEDAESELTNVLSMLDDHDDHTTARRRIVHNGFIALYDAWQKNDRAALHRRRLTELPAARSDAE